MKIHYPGRAALITSAAMLFAATPAFARPTISTVTPVTATAGVPVTLSATVSSGATIQSCNLYIDLADVGEMNVSSGTASKSFTFPFGGSRLAFVFCRDVNGDINSGPNTAIWVEGPTESEQPPFGGTPPPQDEPPAGPPAEGIAAASLIKLTCQDGADVNDPCKAVYYVDAEGARHPFPNARIFMSWYENFDSVIETDLATIASFPLGANVRYRPGARMVKFTTDPRVYAVSRWGVLRWVPTESLAISLYGEDWNTKIDDIPDTFFLDYTFGPDVESVTDYSAQNEFESTTTIEANLS
jgi:hypothetical protein